MKPYLQNKKKLNSDLFVIDNIDQYCENNRLEAKKAKGGLPHSVWETYSSFANTHGGIILLGVSEKSDQSFVVSGLDNPEELIKNFWDDINNTNKVNINILTNNAVSIEKINGKQIIVIRVPRADRTFKPVFIGKDMFTGTYRRNGEGDYHCTRDEISAMFRDAGNVSQDFKVLPEMDISVFDEESIQRYRNRFSSVHIDHVWNGLDKEQFLRKIGALGVFEETKTIHPTIAGLLMFGFEYEIVREFPQFFLDYQERFDDNTRWTDRIVSSSGDWSGNVFDFFFKVLPKLVSDIKKPFVLDKETRIDDTPIHKALREALVNTLVHADYYGRRGIVIIKTVDDFTFSNPGCLRITLNEAISGGISDPRNSVLLKMFSLIDVGERAGSGIPGIISIWLKTFKGHPLLSESFDPERTELKLSRIIEIGDKPAINQTEKEEIGDKSAINSTEKEETGDKSAINSTENEKIGDKSAINPKEHDKKLLILEYLKENSFCKSKDIATLLQLKPSRTKDYLKQLVADGFLVIEGANKNRIYRLSKKI